VLFSTHYLAEAEPADRGVLPPGPSWRTTHLALCAELGERSRRRGSRRRTLARAIRGLGAARLVSGPAEASAPASRGSASRSWSLRGRPGDRALHLRPTTLEDVYFARTQGHAAADVPEPV
jgi:hypothetical protein